MPRSQPQPESPDKDVGSGSLDRFKALTERLVSVDPAALQRALEERRARKRGKTMP